MATPILSISICTRVFGCSTGACRLERLMEKAHELKFPALRHHRTTACSTGPSTFTKACPGEGIKPHRRLRGLRPRRQSLWKKTSSGGRDVYNHLVCWAKDETGYKNLVKLATCCPPGRDTTNRAIDRNCWRRNKEGLMPSSGCLASEIPEAFSRGIFCPKHARPSIVQANPWAG